MESTNANRNNLGEAMFKLMEKFIRDGNGVYETRRVAVGKLQKLGFTNKDIVAFFNGQFEKEDSKGFPITMGHGKNEMQSYNSSS